MKNVSLQMKINGVLEDIMVKTGADNVIVNSTTGETLSARLTSIASDLSSAVSGGVTTAQVNSLISAAIDDLVNGAPATYDTLKEIADYLATHQNEYTALVQTVAGKVDAVEGKGLSANDFTTALLNKLNAIAEGATKVEASTTNGKIKVNGTETTVYTHPTGSHVRSGSTVPSDLAEGELFIKFED